MMPAWTTTRSVDMQPPSIRADYEHQLQRVLVLVGLRQREGGLLPGRARPPSAHIRESDRRNPMTHPFKRPKPGTVLAFVLTAAAGTLPSGACGSPPLNDLVESAMGGHPASRLEVLDLTDRTLGDLAGLEVRCGKPFAPWSSRQRLFGLWDRACGQCGGWLVCASRGIAQCR